MLQSLRAKLIAAFALVGLISMALAGLMIRELVIREFDTYLLEQYLGDFSTSVQTYYERTGSLADIQQRPLSNEGPRAVDGRPNPAPPVRFALADAQGQIVIPLEPYRLGETVPDDVLSAGTPIEYEGQVIGTALQTDATLLRNPSERVYVSRTNRALVAATVAAAVVAVGLGFVSATLVTRPLREMMGAVRHIGKGDFTQTVPVRSRDELGLLAEQFNQMSRDLAHANQLRRQMTADVAHDLRSPLTVITGYLESMQEGVLDATPERIQMLYDEAQSLQHLIEDLRMLSLADAGELVLKREAVHPGQLLDHVAGAFHQQAAQNGVDLSTQAERTLPKISVDADRMLRVLSNLVGNALRYTSRGGHIALAARAEAGRMLFTVSDDGEGIPAEHLPNIFERSYRGEKARDQNAGDAGLGLAIARSIVEAHGGQITASSAAHQGATFTISLPL